MRAESRCREERFGTRIVQSRVLKEGRASQHTVVAGQSRPTLLKLDPRWRDTLTLDDPIDEKVVSARREKT